MKINIAIKWDGYRRRVIIFDIPKNLKKRETLYKKIKDLEMYPLQKSVFVCPLSARMKLISLGNFST